MRSVRGRYCSNLNSNSGSDGASDTSNPSSPSNPEILKHQRLLQSAVKEEDFIRAAHLKKLIQTLKDQ